MPKSKASARVEPSPITPNEKLLTTEEVAEWLNVSVRTVEDWIFDGRLKPIKVGRLNRFPQSRVQAFIQEAV
jgi:excisionase family DNA binding protein